VPTDKEKRFVDWITDKIAIGDAEDAVKNAAAVDILLCLTRDCCENRCDANGCCISLHDGPGNVRGHVLTAIEFLAESVAKGLKILVHCRAGRSRSVAVVAAYFMKHRGLSQSQALKVIGEKRHYLLSPGIEEIFSYVGTEETSLCASLLGRIAALVQGKTSQSGQ
jgi:Dual specificity phosphatase, catalytic domain